MNLLATHAEHSDERGRLREFGPAILLLIVGILGLAVATFSPSGKDGQYAVITPPWYSLGDTIALVQAADGRVADIAPSNKLVIAQSENPHFVKALYRSGAWLVLDPVQLRGCINFRPAYGKAQT